MTSKRLACGLAAACSFMALAGAAFADPPGRVGRVSAVEGQVSFRPAGEDFWAPASRNLPATSGEAFWTDERSRLELQIAGVEARLDAQSELDVLDLDWGVTRLSLPQGSVDLHVWRAPRGGVIVATPAGEVRITQPGVYRVDALPAEGEGDYGPIALTTFRGEALLTTDQGPTPVDAGQSATWLPGYDPDYEYAEPTGIDRWAWARDAEQAARRRDEALWVSYTGADDLDDAGDWTDDPQYGRVWFPRDVGPDWAPYRYGHWSYIRPWGWTWIDDQPWGFTPFHYGRWARFGDRWGWVPGRLEAEPVYAPALVAFVGGGGWGVSIGVSGGALGWVPLAPQEVYVPTYRVSDDYVRRLNVPHAAPAVINTVIVNNIHNTTIVNNTTVVNRTVVVYRNAPAATVVPAAAFARGASVQQAVVRIAPGAIAHAPVAPVALDKVVAPTREARAALPAGPAAQGPRGPNGAPTAAPRWAPSLADAPHPPARLQVLRAAVAAQAPGTTGPAPTLRPSVPTTTATGKPLQLHLNANPNTGAPHPTAGPGPSRPNGGWAPQGAPQGAQGQHAQPPAEAGRNPPAWAPQRTSTPPAPPAPPPSQPMNHDAPPPWERRSQPPQWGHDAPPAPPAPPQSQPQRPDFRDGSPPPMNHDASQPTWRRSQPPQMVHDAPPAPPAPPAPQTRRDAPFPQWRQPQPPQQPQPQAVRQAPPAPPQSQPRPAYRPAPPPPPKSGQPSKGEEPKKKPEAPQA